MTENATNGPFPARFVFLSDLPSLPPATKVRFLGCVVEYDSIKGRLLLEHAYPKNEQAIPRASVDVTLILETTPSSMLEKGRWINVVGYVQTTHQGSRKRKIDSTHDAGQPVSLQAVLMWDAGPLRIADYEATLKEHIQVRRQLDLRGK